MKRPSITLLICTYNGEKTIQQTLEAIANQTDISRYLFEVIVVDNASSDRTSEIAASTLQRLNLDGRVLLEPRIGKVNAFLRGVQEAQGELISIVDDDNFIEPGFICYTLELFNQYPDVGMVGSKNSLHAEQPVPQWFSWVRGRYACAQPMLADIEVKLSGGAVIAKTGVIAGAGSTFRVKPLRQCIEKGYSFFNDTQRGKNMSVTGEDLELCWLMHSLGYRFAFDPRIQIRHAIKAERLTLKYLKALSRSQGAGALGADPFMFTYKFNDSRWPVQWTWQWQLLSKVKRYLELTLLGMTPNRLDEESRFRNWTFRVECMGAIRRILLERNKYTSHIYQVAAGEWTDFRVH
ncbi:glycosyltransferase [Leptolyngbya sp. FACHB-711]|uniref:glycosyltransferase n=1 Tax=Leptolyngbya sp. FACHB-711 TaxID=2692813 RepID=UPI001684CDFD|nr:glycosyltransferase [Leptolyngbya sp. FACHB-711]MBD2028216.1 glycosyltransferase family 2 protein [Leptolyngbya sp. FACHB-711]